MTIRKTDNKQLLFRDLTLDRKGMQENSRMIPASLSSEKEVQRWFGREILVHDEKSVNLERAADGLPLLYMHDHTQPIGLAKNVRVDGSKLRADLHFSENQKAREVWADVAGEYLKNVSIGYRVHEYKDDENSDIRRVTNWEVYEASVVTVPADSGVGINRAVNIEEIEMAEDTETRAAGETDAGQGSGVDVGDMNDKFKVARIRAIEEGRKEGMQLEQDRRDAITSVFSRFDQQEGAIDLCEVCISNGMTVDQARDALLRWLGEGVTPISRPLSDEIRTKSKSSDVGGWSNRATIGEDAIDKFKSAAEVAISVQANGVYTEEERKESIKHEFHSMTVTDMAREFLRITGKKPTGRREDIIGMALQRDISHGSSHFANLLENVANKSMLRGFEEAPETWNMWCQTKNIPDFKPATLLNLSLFSDMDKIPEMGQYTYGDMSDIKESIQLATYGKMFGISRQALANDDLNGLAATPSYMGKAAARKIGDIAYAVLTDNALMNQDGIALFATAHNNYVTAGAAPSVATLQAAELAMSLQTDPSGATVTMVPSYMLVPRALRISSEILMASMDNPDTTGDRSPNPFRGSFTVVADRRLDAANSAGWYLATNSDTVVVGFLNGQQTPYLETRDGWSTDGVEYKVRIDAAAAAADFRGVFYHDGVT